MGGPCGGPGGVRRPSQRGWEGIQEGWEELEGPPVAPGEVCRPSRWARRSPEALKEGWERLEGPRGGLGGVKRPSSRAGKGWKALPEI